MRRRAIQVIAVVLAWGASSVVAVAETEEEPAPSTLVLGVGFAGFGMQAGGAGRSFYIGGGRAYAVYRVAPSLAVVGELVAARGSTFDYPDSRCCQCRSYRQAWQASEAATPIPKTRFASRNRDDGVGVEVLTRDGGAMVLDVEGAGHEGKPRQKAS